MHRGAQAKASEAKARPAADAGGSEAVNLRNGNLSEAAPPYSLTASRGFVSASLGGQATPSSSSASSSNLVKSDHVTNEAGPPRERPDAGLSGPEVALPSQWGVEGGVGEGGGSGVDDETGDE